jgi:hypothetical protein
MGERRRLINLTYRLLGSLAEAEDAVQETYARWYAMTPQQQEAIENPRAWLSKVASRICLNLLGSARARRETYVGEWIPEPLPERAEWITGRPRGTTPPGSAESCYHPATLPSPAGWVTEPRRHRHCQAPARTPAKTHNADTKRDNRGR